MKWSSTELFGKVEMSLKSSKNYVKSILKRKSSWNIILYGDLILCTWMCE